MTDSTANEARRILKNMSSAAGYNGVCSAAVVDYMVENLDLTVFCNGYLRKIVFTPITKNNYTFKTEAA